MKSYKWEEKRPGVNKTIFFLLIFLLSLTTQTWGEEKGYDIQSLIGDLTSNSQAVRERAIKRLGRIGWKPENKREEAVFLIAKNRWDEVVRLGEYSVEPLIVLLKDEQWYTKNKVVEALGNIGDKRAVEPLIATLKDEDPDVRDEVIKALGKIGDNRILTPLITILKDKEENWHVRKKSVEVLGKIGEPAVKLLIAILKDDNLEIRESAAEALGRIGEPAVKPLIDVLRYGDWDIRMESAEALGMVGEPAIKPLINLLRDVDWFVRKKAAYALTEIGKPAVKPLIAALKDDDPKVRENVTGVLGNIGDKRAVAPLITMLKDSSSDVREKAAGALGTIGEPAVKPLIDTLKDKYWYVRWGAAKTLESIGWKPENDTEMALFLIAKKEWYAVSRIGAPAIKPLINNLWDEYWYVRWEASEALRRMGWKPKNDTEMALFFIAKNKWDAATNLGTPAVKPLITSLHGWGVKEGAIKALGDIGDKRAVKPLIAILQEENWHVRKRAVEALEKLGDRQAIPALVDTLKDWWAGGAAARALKKLGWTPSTLEEGIHLLVAERKAHELKIRWVDTKNILLQDVRSNNQRIIENAVFTFIGLGKKESIDNLLKILDSEGTKIMAETFLNSGNKELKEAAKNWAISHEYIINAGQVFTHIRWGEM